MRELTLVIPRDRRAAYLRIADAVRTAIRHGDIRAGESLPSTRVLARQTGVHRHTVMAAIGELVAEGWLQAEERRGYRVVTTLPAEFFRARAVTSTAAQALARDSLRPLPPLASSYEPVVAPPEKVRWDLRAGHPDLRLFPYDELKTHFQASLRRRLGTVFDYGDPQGHPPFLAELSGFLRRVRNVSGRELVVTHGSQEAIFITANLFLRKADAVAVEQLSYPAACSVFRACGATLYPIAIDDEGILPDKLEALCRRRRIKLLYLTPLHQYPTTVTLSAPRRLEVYAIAARHGVRILEDDYDHEYHYRCQPLPPLAADDPAELVVSVSTFSKLLFPSARLGFAMLPPSLKAPFLALRRRITTQNDALLQDAVARWMREDGFQRHLNRTRRYYERRLSALTAYLERRRNEGLELSWREPDGGMALWLRTPWDTRRLTERAAREGILLLPEHPMRDEPGPGRHLRLGFARHSEEEMRRALDRLFRLVGSDRTVV